MDTITKVLVTLGAILASAIILALPILTALSFVFDWHGLAKSLLVIATAGEYILCAFALIERVDI